MDAAEVVAGYGGLARSDQLLRHLTSRELTEAVRTGALVRRARGRYELAGAPVARAAAHRLSGALAGPSAAQDHGWPVLRPPDRPWVAVPATRNVPAHRRRGVRIVWSSEETGRSVTSPLRTVLDCARRLPLPEALAVADSALRSGTVEADELRHAGAGATGRGADTVRLVAAEATVLAANPLESALRALSLGVPGLRLVPQASMVVEGVEIHPDLSDDRLGLVVEAEGWLYHGGPEQFAQDLWRYTALTVSGRTVLRFGHDAVTLRPEWVSGCLASSVRTGERRSGCRICA